MQKNNKSRKPHSHGIYNKPNQPILIINQIIKLFVN